MLTGARFSEILAIKQAGARGERPLHPDYAAIKAAEARFIDEPIIAAEARTGQLPEALYFPRPKTDIEHAAQLVAVNFLRELIGRPVAIHFSGPQGRAVARVAHAFRVARRTLLHRR